MDRKDTIESIIVKFLSGSSKEEESVQLLDWLKENRENRRFYFSLKRVWLKTNKSEENEKFIEDSWDRLKLRTTLQSKVADRAEKGLKIDLRKLSIAASILVLIGISLFLGIQLRSFSDHRLTTHEISVPMGSRTNITLPDGTSVWLNAGSKLTYTSDFSFRNRDVTLSGEAYFDVSPHRSSLFTVNTRDMNIRALGTEFNVKSYPDEDVTETTLVSGRVEIAVTDQGIAARPVLLKPNQKITYSRAQGSIVFRPVETDNEDILVEYDDTVEELSQKPSLQIAQISSPEEYISWKDGKLVFRAETLKTLAPKLERFYNVNISFEDDSIKELSYTGTLDEVTIEEVLRAIAKSSDISFKIDKNKVIFNKN